MEAAIYNRNAGEGRRGTGRWPSTLITLRCSRSGCPTHWAQREARNSPFALRCHLAKGAQVSGRSPWGGGQMQVWQGLHRPPGAAQRELGKWYQPAGAQGQARGAFFFKAVFLPLKKYN